ncbi:MAG: T9SS type A sorting domain-containing protein [Prevotellaceae bacterium]|jgi:hypothetical protein|nr:T9SS type A sorting domain-containing protein [Prevotellaceae bacterium]
MKREVLLSLIVLGGLSMSAQVKNSDLHSKSMESVKPAVSINKAKPAGVELQRTTNAELRKAAVVQKNVTDAAPVARYAHPVGTYFLGFDSDFELSYLGIVGPADVPWTYEDVSTGALSTSWAVNSSAVAADADGNFSQIYDYLPADQAYALPTLTATNATGTSTYKYGAASSSYAFVPNPGEYFPLSNASWYLGEGDYDYYTSYSDGEYIYGTGIVTTGVTAVGFLSVYDQPLAALAVDSVFVPFYSAANAPLAPLDTLKLTVTSADGNTILGKSYITSTDLKLVYTYSSGGSIYVAPFAFKTVGLFGAETDEEIVINEAFKIAIGGISATVDLGLYVDTENLDGHSAYTVGSDGLFYSDPRFNSNFHLALHGTFDDLPVAVKNTTAASQLSTVATFGADYKVTYPADFTSLKLYSVTGQLISEYKLPATGEAIVPASNLSKGTYLLRFEGARSETVKVIK